MKSVRTDGGLQVAGEKKSTDEYAVVAPLEQLFTGLQIGLSTRTIRCCACGSKLGDGETVSVYAYRTVETPRWHLARCRCPDCASEDIATPTLGVTEVHLTARLAVVSDGGRQQHRLCLADPTVSATSSPQDSSPPSELSIRLTPCRDTRGRAKSDQ